MRRLILAALAAAPLALASCAAPPPAPAATAAGTAAPGPSAAGPSAPGRGRCGAEALSTRFRPGQDLPFVFTVKANSQWCFDGFNLSGLSTEGQAIDQAPAHGDLRLSRQQGMIIFGYRPAPGYVGPDHFRISVPSQVDSAYFAGSVTVAP